VRVELRQPGDPNTVVATVTYKYDVFGNLIERSAQQNGTTTTTRYGYDGNRVWVDLDGDNNNAVQVRYVYGPLGPAPAARVSATTVHWYLSDTQGSVLAIANGQGQPVARQKYSAFGKVKGEDSAGLNDRWGFQGAQRDPLTQLWLVQGQWYDGATSRWLGEYGGTAFSNRYSSQNLRPNPAPLGTMTEEAPWARFERLWEATRQRLQQIWSGDEPDGVAFRWGPLLHGGPTALSDDFFRRGAATGRELSELFWAVAPGLASWAADRYLPGARETGLRMADEMAADLSAAWAWANSGPGLDLSPVFDEPVGEPGFWTGLIPFYGSGRSFIHDVQTGQYGWAVVHGGLFVLDAALAKTVLVGGGKLLLRAGGKALGRQAATVEGKALLGQGGRLLAEEGAAARGLAPRTSSLLHSIEDAANFERTHFGGRFLNEGHLVELQIGLEERFAARGLEFEGIFLNGPPVNRFVPRFNARGELIGGRIELIGVPQRQPLIRVLDEVSHAMDAAEPGFVAMLSRYQQMGATRGADIVRVISHSELFQRAASRLEAGDPILRTILTQEDVPLLRLLAQELLR
jgi:hypothetical protein